MFSIGAYSFLLRWRPRSARRSEGPRAALEETPHTERGPKGARCGGGDMNRGEELQHGPSATVDGYVAVDVRSVS